MVKKKRETLFGRYFNWRHFHKSLSSKTAGRGCLHDQNQTSYWLCFEPLSQTNELKQKTDISLSRCPTFLPFLETLLFSHLDYSLLNHCSYLRLTIIFSVQAPPPSHCIKHRHEWSPSCWRKLPLRSLIVFKTQLHLICEHFTIHHSDPLKEHINIYVV